MNTIGVDVDSRNLVCQIRRNCKDYPPATFRNDPVGHRRFVKWATKRGQSARACMEATGVYSLPFALMLHTVALIEVMVVNPKAMAPSRKGGSSFSGFGGGSGRLLREQLFLSLRY